MKQRTSPEQLKELTGEQQERLRDWWTPKWGDIVIDTRGNIALLSNLDIARQDKRGQVERDFQKSYCLPLLPIGQMVELLIEKYGRFYASYDYISPESKRWDLCWPGVFFQNEELADALWEVVKEVL